MERKGTLRGRDGRNGTWGKCERRDGKERKDERTGEKAPQQTCVGENDKLDTSSHQRKTLYLFSLFHPPRQMLTFSGSPVQEAPRCVSCLCLTRGIMGVEVQSIQERGLSLMEECCCLPLRPPSQLETHLWAFLSSLPVRSKQLPPFSAHLHFPVVLVRHTHSE